MPADATIIEVQNLVRKFGDRAVLDDHLVQRPSWRDARHHGRQWLRQEHTAPAHDWVHETDFGIGETFWRRNHRDEGTRD